MAFAEEVIRHDDAAFSPLELSIDLGFVPVNVVDEAHGRGIDADTVMGAVHTVLQGGLEEGQAQPMERDGIGVLLVERLIAGQSL